jgi:hypothetical protein
MLYFIDDPLGRFQSVAVSLQGSIGAIRTVEIAASFGEYGARDVMFKVLIKVEQLVGGQGRGIQISDQFSGDLVDATIIPVDTARNIINASSFH